MVEFYFRVTLSPDDGTCCEKFTIGDPRKEDWVDEATWWLNWYELLELDEQKSWVVTGKARIDGLDDDITVIEQKACEVLNV